MRKPGKRHRNRLTRSFNLLTSHPRRLYNFVPIGRESRACERVKRDVAVLGELSAAVVGVVRGEDDT